MQHFLGVSSIIVMPAATQGYTVTYPPVSLCAKYGSMFSLLQLTREGVHENSFNKNVIIDFGGDPANT